MATDYNEIGQNPRINYRKIFTPYSDKTHFIYELVQNADDNKSQCIEMQLYENELIVWNDGCQFSEEDVRSICSIGFSNKDLTQIGTFGMGFKAVYAYTDNPEIYSGDERFRISISNPTQPEGIDGDIDVRVSDQLKEGKRLKKNRTIFRLPFRKELRQEEEIALLKNRFRDLEKRALLFLRNLKTVQWYDGNSGQRGSYSCHRRPHDKIQDASEVELRSSLNGEDQSSETFWVFRKEIQPPQVVIDELLQQSEDDDERQRIQKSAKKLQPIEIAFKFQDGKIIAMDNCMLFSYFPTEKETHLKFLIQASYKTSLARENIEKDNQWNEWLIEETADFIPEVLEDLKKAGLLEPAFFNLLPLKGEVENEFKPIADASRKAIKEKPLIPTEDGGYAKSENVFYPDSIPLRELIKSSGMHSDNSLLHSDIQNNEKFRRCFKVIREAGVEVIRIGQFLSWLEGKSVKWFEAKSNEWLFSFYIYLKEQRSYLERIKRLPLIRLENGEHVSASDQSVYFPPDERTIRDTNIKPLLDDLPILQSILLEREECYEVEAFLKNLGVTELDPEDLIRDAICPLYSKTDKPSTEQNCQHIRYIFKVWQKRVVARSSLEKMLRTTLVLRGCSGIRSVSDENSQPIEKVEYVKSSDAYISEAYTGDTYLERYFSYNSNIWFVDNVYLEDESDAKDWCRFLKAIGVKDTPPIFERQLTGSIEACKERGIKRERSTRPFEYGEFKYVWPSGYFDGHIVDYYLDGLSEVLAQIGNHNEADLPRALWGLLVKFVSSLPSEESQRHSFFRERFLGDYRWFYRTDRWRSFDATFYRQLKSKAWILDEQGSLHTPSECFVPTSENRKLLGDSVVYLPKDFDLSTEPAKWLAEKLDVRMEADAESVLRHLHQLRNDKEISIKKIEPLYRFLYSVRPRRKINGSFTTYMSDSIPSWRSNFKTEPLVFIPNTERCWWQVDEVFWEDESVVFGKDRGYLKSHYAEGLKSFFTNSLAVSERATASDYVHRIQKIKSMEQAAIAEVQTLYERLWRVMQESNGISSNRLGMDPSVEFTEKPLIFTPNQKRCWWRVNKVFWEDESVVFGDDRGYLKSHYPETLKPFFIKLGISERSAPLDYVSGIKEVADVGEAENSEVRKRIKRLYSRVWQSLQEGGTWQEDEDWKQVREESCWLGKKGDEWGFFLRHELVYNDHHEYIAEIFEGEIPFWMFDGLFDFVGSLEVEGCSQAGIEFNPKGDQEELTNLSKEVCKLRPYIHAFLNSPRLCEGHKKLKSADILNQLSVHLVEELETMYTLKEISLASPNPRASFLDVTNQEVKLWLALEADEDDYPLLIGDALRDYYGVEALGRFTEHLLTKKQNNVLEHWKRDGLQTQFCVLSSDVDSERREEKLIELGTGKLLDKTEIGNTVAATNGSDVENPMDGLGANGEKSDSVMDKADESQNLLSSDEGSDSTVDEPEVETPIDNGTSEVGKAEGDSTSEKSGAYTEVPSDTKGVSSSGSQTPTATKSTTTQPAESGSEHGSPEVKESPGIGNRGTNSPTTRAGIRTYTSSRTSGTSRSGGHSLSTSSGRSGRGGHGGSGGGGESDEHWELKQHLAEHTSELDTELKLVKVEHTFGSNDRVDILLKDSSGKPVTVEVETGFSSGAGRFVGIWQAVKYQHLAAVEYGLSCEEVRSILAAPEIPDDVKSECERLGIEPIEVSLKD